MLIESDAGDFEMEIQRIWPRAGNLVLSGKMGIWESNTVVSPREAFHLLGMLVSPGVLWHLVRLPWLALRQGNR